MKTIVITEGICIPEEGERVFNLLEMGIKPCCGCFGCWLKTPGRCRYKELDPFYHQYITADCAVYLVKVKQGFVSSDLKALWDRMLPLYLPYIWVKEEGCTHVPRYDRYPDVTLYYEGTFRTEREEEIFEDYVKRVFEQFSSKVIGVKAMAYYREREGEVK